MFYDIRTKSSESIASFLDVSFLKGPVTERFDRGNPFLAEGGHKAGGETSTVVFGGTPSSEVTSNLSPLISEAMYGQAL